MKKSIITSLACMPFLSLFSAQDRPNIIVFLVDDMGLMDTSVPFIVNNDGEPEMQPLNEWYRTPNMERLASQGVRFSTFYAQSVSSPSRTSMMTGQNAARHHTTNWINSESNNRDTYGPYEWNWTGLKRTDMIYPLVLSKAGYKTIHIGKAHFGCFGSEGEDPIKLGFDVNVGGSSIGEPGSYLGENGYGHIAGNRKRAVPDLEKYHGTDTFLSDALTIEAVKEIQKAVAEGKPFYLNMSHYAVHTPLDVDKRFIDNYPHTKKDDARAFAALVEGMDKSLGDLMDKLNEMGIAENTMIIFLGDNGSNAPLGDAADYGSSAPLKGKKGAEYEGGVRVPFIAAWAKPDDTNRFQKEYPVARNYVQTLMGTIMDIYPTVLSIAGVEAPEGHVLDGSDLKKLFAGKKDNTRRDDLLIHFPHEHRGNYFTTYRKGDWKLIYYYNPDKDGVPSYKLYNLADDPYEKYDVASENSDKVRELCKLMVKRLELEGAQYPVGKDNKPLYPVIP